MSNSRSLAWCAWLIASIFYAYQYVLRVMPNIMLTDIMEQFDINAVVFGQFSGAYYIGYCVFHIPIGILLDRFGSRKVMSGCILMTVVGLLPIIFAENWVYPILGRILIGAGSSAAVLGAFKIIRMGFEEKHFTRMLSIMVTIGLIGAIYGGLPVGYLVEAYGHKAVVSIFATLGVAFALATFLFIPDIKEEKNDSTILSDIKTVLSNKKVLAVCFFAGLMVGPMEGFADAWGSEYLKQVYGFDSDLSNSLTSMIYMGMCFAPLLSRVAEKSGNYSGTIMSAGFVMLAAFLALMTGAMGVNSIFTGFFMVGVCCAYQILAIYKASTYVPEHVSGLTTAVTNMIIMSFGYVFHSLIGVIINSGATFTQGIGIIPAALLVGATGFAIITYQERGEKQIALSN